MEPLIDTDTTTTTRPVPEGVDPDAWGLVLKGAALLDGIPDMEGWREYIDPARFDVQYAERCVLGSQPGGWHPTQNLIERSADVEGHWTVTHGFDVSDDDLLRAIKRADALTAAWKAYLWPEVTA